MFGWLQEGRTEAATVVEIGHLTGEGDLPASYILLDRSRSSLDATVDAGPRSGALTLTGGRLRLRVLVDRSALEIFANGRPLTARAYPTLGGGCVRVSAAGGVRLHQLDAEDGRDLRHTPASLSGVIGCSTTALLRPERAVVEQWTGKQMMNNGYKADLLSSS